MTIAEKTVGQWLEELAGNTVSNEADAKRMQGLLRRVGLSRAIVTSGIVYLEGEGTVEAPPADIHSVARMLVDRARRDQ